MSDNEQIDYPEMHKKLLEIISRAEKKYSKEFEKPSVETIKSYLLGTATEGQSKEVWRAIEASKEFCQVLLEMEEELEVFSSPDTADKAASIQVDRIPVRVLRTVEKRGWSPAVKILIPIAAAAVITLVGLKFLITGGETDQTLKQPVNEVGRLELVSQNIDPGLLVSTSVRGQSEDKTHSAPDSAALGEFRFLLEYKDGEFKFHPEVTQPRPGKESRIVQLKLQDDTGKIIKEFTAVIPASDSATAPVKAWILNLHQRSLYKVDMTSDTISVEVGKDEMSKGCVTFTYGGDNWFSSTFGFTYFFQEAK